MKNVKRICSLIMPVLILALAFCLGTVSPKKEVLAEGELKQMNVIIDEKPAYIKYKGGSEVDLNPNEYFVVENEDLIAERTTGIDGNRYKYVSTLNYSALVKSHNDAGESWVVGFVGNKGYYDLYITITDTRNNYAKYEVTIEDYFIVADEEGMDIPTFTATYNGKQQVATIPTDAKYDVLANEGGINVGEYEVTLKSKNVEVFFWNGVEDKTQDTVTAKFQILKETNNQISGLKITSWNYGQYDAVVNAPSATSTVGEIVYTYYNSNSEVVEDIANAPAGLYTLEAKVEETDNHSGVTETISFEIAKQTVGKPEKDSSLFTYNGMEQTYDIAENDAYIITGNKQTDAGNYTVYVEFKKENCYEWTDGSTDRLEFEFIIEKQSVSIPIVNSKDYNGRLQVADVSVSNLYGVVKNTGNLGGINAGNYDVIFQLKDAKNYRWGDDTVGDSETVKVIFEIKKNYTNYIANLAITDWAYSEYDEGFNKPSGNANLGEIVYTYKNFNGEVVENIANAPAGNYTLIAKVEETDNYVGASEQVSFKILKKQIDKPTENKNKFIYNGSEQIYLLVENSAYTITNNKQTDTGLYFVTVALKDKSNYIWSDSTIDNLTFNFVINKASISIPNLDSKAYNGEIQIADIAEDNRIIVIKNNGGINVGNYEVILKISDDSFKNYAWKDEAEQTITLSFEIEKYAYNMITNLSISNWVIGETAKTPNGYVKFGEITYKYVGLNSNYNSNVAPTKAGSYKLIASVLETDNYNGCLDECTFEIVKKDFVLENETPQKVTEGEKGGFVVPENCGIIVEYAKTGTDNWSTNVPKEVGVYDVKLRILNENETYNVYNKIIEKGFEVEKEPFGYLWIIIVICVGLIVIAIAIGIIVYNEKKKKKLVK